MQADRPALGLLLMLGFCMLAPMADAMAKLLGDRVGLAYLVLLRFVIQAAWLIPLSQALGQSMRMKPWLLWRTFLRTILHILGIGLMFTALRYLPLADTTAIAFVMPFIILLLGHWLLGEEVGPRRLIACAVGFVGTLLVVQPAFRDVGWPAILPIGVAINFALFMLVTRSIAKQVDPIGMQAVSATMACVLLAPILVLAPKNGGSFWAMPATDWSTWALILAMGTVGSLGHLVMTWSLRYAPSATLAPMQYLEIPFAALVGWVVFRDFPNGLALLGIAVTMASGLYIMHRERATHRALPPTPRAQPPMPPEAE